MTKVVVNTLSEGKKGTSSAKSRRNLVETFYEFTGNALVWASPGFISAYKHFRQAGQQEDHQALLYLDDMLREMRDDLGHDDSGLQRGDLIKLFITDEDSVDRLRAAVEEGRCDTRVRIPADLPVPGGPRPTFRQAAIAAALDSLFAGEK